MFGAWFAAQNAEKARAAYDERKRIQNAKQQESELQALRKQVESLERAVAELTRMMRREQLPKDLAAIAGSRWLGRGDDNGR